MKRNRLNNLKIKLSYEREMKEHYESLYQTSFQEMKFNGEQKQMLDDLLCEVHDLLKK